jgi:hydrogenase expression/formation protein HypE
MEDLGRVATAVGKAAERAGVRLVTGDTKVVDHDSGDGVYVNTAGIGVVADGVDIGPHRATPGDVVLVSGDIGVHGVAVMSCREGLEFGTTVESDSAPLHGLVGDLLESGVDVHALRDPTRGGVAATLNEIASTARVGVEVVERDIPVPAEVRDACGLLGLDPLQVANEGKLVAVVAADDADRALDVMRAHPLGVGACRIGAVVAEHPAVVVTRTGLGATRVLDLPVGEQLPRIC